MQTSFDIWHYVVNGCQSKMKGCGISAKPCSPAVDMQHFVNLLALFHFAFIVDLWYFSVVHIFA